MIDNKTAIAFALTSKTITLNFDGETHALYLHEPGTAEVIAALKEKRWSDIPELVSKAKAIGRYTEGTFVVDNGVLKIDGQEVPSSLATKILKFKDEGLPYEGLVNFAKNLLTNPSFRSVHQLFSFLDKNEHPITESGEFIAYKWVNEDWYDTYTGNTFLNVPGATIEMPRNQVNEDPNQTCSKGLHVANWDYALNHYGSGRQGRMIEVKVQPADVVAVPTDYNNAKMRVCKYVVIGEVKSERKSLLIDKDDKDYVVSDEDSFDGTEDEYGNAINLDDEELVEDDYEQDLEDEIEAEEERERRSAFAEELARQKDTVENSNTEPKIIAYVHSDGTIDAETWNRQQEQHRLIAEEAKKREQEAIVTYRIKLANDLEASRLEQFKLEQAKMEANNLAKQAEIDAYNIKLTNDLEASRLEQFKLDQAKMGADQASRLEQFKLEQAKIEATKLAMQCGQAYLGLENPASVWEKDAKVEDHDFCKECGVVYSLFPHNMSCSKFF